MRKLMALKDELKHEISADMMKIVNLSAEKGASLWLTSMPLPDKGFRLSKQQFTDALCMRYNLKPTDTPRTCTCGESFSIDHILSCKMGGFVHYRHNTVRDTIADMLEEVCKDVVKEPPLLPLSGEILPPGSNTTDGARADISGLNFWSPLCRAFYDIRVFSPLAPSNWNKDIEKMHEHHEREKKREYNVRIQEVDRGSFTPLVFSCHGGASPETNKFLKELARQISNKRGEEYGPTLNFIRRRIRFDLLKSCLICLRGERKRRGQAKILDIEFGFCPLEIDIE